MKRALFLVLASSVSFVACNLGKNDDRAQPASEETARVVSSGAPPAEAPAAEPTAAAAPKTTDQKSADSSGSPAGKPNTIAQKGEKKVMGSSDGKNVQLENETGKGSVVTSGGKTTVTGKSGRSIEIPLGR